MSRSQNRNIQRPWTSPDPENRYNYDSDDCVEFGKLLKNYPWNQHRWYGDEGSNDRCERINDNKKIPNPITELPKEIYPYQAVFASHHGYLPKGFSISKRKTKRSKNRCKIPRISRKQRLKNRSNKRKREENMRIYQYNKHHKRTKRRKTMSKKKEISHICGKKSCITIIHAELANSKQNRERSKHHKEIDKVEKIKEDNQQN